MRIGIIGAGMIGSTVAKLWVDAGHEVRIASRHPEELQPLVERLGTQASAGTPRAAATFGEVVMLTVPLAAMPDVARDLAAALRGKVVLDTGNAYEKRDGQAARDAASHPQGSAGWAAAMFPDARWVKAFNTVYFKVLEREAHRDGDRLFLYRGDHSAGRSASAFRAGRRQRTFCGACPCGLRLHRRRSAGAVATA